MRRNVLITGASRGLGSDVARAFWKTGADLLLVGRDADALDAFISTLDGSGQQTAFACSTDLSLPGAAEEIVEVARTHFETLDVLINNAAVQGPIGLSWENDWHAWNEALTVDLIAPIDLSRRCAAWMIPQRRGKIVCLSGGGATGSRPNFSSYAVAKTGLVRFCEILSDELRPYNIQVNCVAPGAMDTAMLDDVLAAGRDHAGPKEYDSALEMREHGGSTAQRAAELVVFLASAASDGLTGKLISAVWDPWENLLDHVDDLNASDVYTLRRIVPKDRGQTWGNP